MKLIGKGAFTKAYLNSDNKVVLKSCCPIKEIIALDWFPESSLFPSIEKVDCDVYEMQYYPKVKSLKNNLDLDQYEIYKTLRSVCNKVGYSLNKFDSYSKIYEAFENYIECEELKTVMCEALDACSNVGSDVGFEISPRNVAVDNGKLVLLDVFFSKSKLNEVKSNKKAA